MAPTPVHHIGIENLYMTQPMAGFDPSQGETLFPADRNVADVFVFQLFITTVIWPRNPLCTVLSSGWQKTAGSGASELS